MKDHIKIDDHKLNYHVDRIKSWIDGENIFPIYIEIGTSSACNHRCIFCGLDYTKYRGKFIDTLVMLKTLTEMGKNGVKAIMFCGEGEPTLHKDFSLFIEHAKKGGIDVAITTNGVLFTEKLAEKCLPHLSWIKFSIDAGTAETYSKIHRTKLEDFEKLMANIKNAVEIRNRNNFKAKIGTQVLLIEENVHELTILCKKVRELGADYFVIKPYSQHPDSSNKFKLDYANFTHLKSKLEALETENFKVLFRLKTMNKLKNDRVYKKCYGMPFFSLIDAEGNVIPCSLYHDKPKYYFGNLYKDSFTEIWNSKKRQEILNTIYESGTDRCKENCRLDAINRYLEDLSNPPEHINFI